VSACVKWESVGTGEDERAGIDGDPNLPKYVQMYPPSQELEGKRKPARGGASTHAKSSRVSQYADTADAHKAMWPTADALPVPASSQTARHMAYFRVHSLAVLANFSRSVL
jgi:hypothetical protein